MHYLLKSGDVCARAIASRCLALVSLIEALRLKEANKSAVSAEHVLTALAEWYPRSTSAEARTNLLHVLSEVTRQVGPRRVELVLSAFAASVRENLLYELGRLPLRDIVSGSPCDFCATTQRFRLEEDQDLHYWQECPGLIECVFCEQVIEISALTEHRLKECESGEARIQFYN